MKLVNFVLRLFGFKRISIKKAAELLSITILVAVLFLPISAQASPPNAPLPPECAEIVHHGLSRFVTEYMNAGQGYAWQRGGLIIYAVKVTECGGAWLYAVWNNGNFVTNFFPSAEIYGKQGWKAGLSKAWNYIQSKVKGMPKIPPPGFACGAYFPFHFAKTGSRWFEGCWLDQFNQRASFNVIANDGIDWCAKGGY